MARLLASLGQKDAKNEQAGFGERTFILGSGVTECDCLNVDFVGVDTLAFLSLSSPIP